MNPAAVVSAAPKRLVVAFACTPVLAVLLVGCTAILGDYNLGDAGGTATSSDAASESSSDATTQGDGASDSPSDSPADAPPDSKTAPPDAAGDGATDSGVEAGPSCPTGQTYCGGSCVNLMVAPGDCGACGHACTLHTLYGDSTCQTGVCSPVELIGFVGEQFVGVAATDGLVFVHVVEEDGGSDISECAADSCDSLTTFESIPFGAQDSMAGSGGVVAWWSQLQGSWTSADGGSSSGTPHYGLGAGLRAMSVGGGNVGYLWFNDFGNHLTVAAQAGFNWTATSDAGTITTPISMDSTNAVFEVGAPDGGGTVETCSIASGCTSAAPIAPASPFAGVLTPYAYLGVPAPSVADAGPTIAYVSLTPPAAPPVVLTHLAPTVSIVQTAIDSTGFYWLDSAGNIAMCPVAPATCPNGGIPVLLGSASNMATQFAVSNGSVFFLAASSPGIVFEAPPPP